VFAREFETDKGWFVLHCWCIHGFGRLTDARLLYCRKSITRRQNAKYGIAELRDPPQFTQRKLHRPDAGSDVDGGLQWGIPASPELGQLR